jgi:hypothetical protein
MQGQVAQYDYCDPFAIAPNPEKSDASLGWPEGPSFFSINHGSEILPAG